MPEPFPDKLKKLPGGSLIQHGPYNDRIYLMKLGDDLPSSIPDDLIVMARQFAYSKIFIKIPAACAKPFTQAGYAEEAAIPRFYDGAGKGVFMGYYLDEARSAEADQERFAAILRLARQKSMASPPPLNRERFVLRRCAAEDANKIAALYKAVFATYPFPIHDPGYVRESMHGQVEYFGIEKDGRLIALSAAEIDRSARNAEMTDFATLPDWRGKSLALHLLFRMEKEMKQKGIKTAYTIARALSPGINITFSKMGYAYGGRLKNNTNISGKVESMNIWHKTIQ